MPSRRVRAVMPGDARDVRAVVEVLREMHMPPGFRVTAVDPERSVIQLRRRFSAVRIAAPKVRVELRQVDRERMEVTVHSWSIYYGYNGRCVRGVLKYIKASQAFGYEPEQQGPPIGPSDAG